MLHRRARKPRWHSTDRKSAAERSPQPLAGNDLFDFAAFGIHVNATTLMLNGPASVTLTGDAGTDTLHGGEGNDEYAFARASVPEADTVVAGSDSGTDTLDFSLLTTNITVRLDSGAALDSGAIQNVHTNRTLLLSTRLHVENVLGGTRESSVGRYSLYENIRNGRRFRSDSLKRRSLSNTSLGTAQSQNSV